MTAVRIDSVLHNLADRPVLRRRQEGIATILIMLLIGLSLTAVALGSMHYIRGAQSQLLSVHSQTQSQMRAWTGAEAVSQFLGKLTAAQLATLATQVNASHSADVTISGIDGVSAKLIAVDNTSAPNSFTADITGVAVEDSQAESRSTVQVVFQVATPVPGTGGNPNTDPRTLQPMHGVGAAPNLKLGGGIEVISDEKTSNFTINVLGDLDATAGNSITGVSKINVTGSISIGSSSSFDELNANCDVILTGSVKGGVINSRRNICTSGGAGGPTAMNANGSIYADGLYDVNGDLAARGKPTDVDSCQAPGFAGDSSKSLVATCPKPNETYVVNLSGSQSGAASNSAGAKSVKAKGSVALGYGHIGKIEAEGDFKSSWGAKADAGSLSGILDTPVQNPDKSNNLKVTEKVTGLSVDIPAVPRVIVDTFIVDAYDYKSVANYVFTVDASGYKKVAVHNVNSIPNAEYYLGSYKVGDNYVPDYLCTKLAADSTSGSPKCLGPYDAGTSLPRICAGQSFNTECFGYDKHVWSVSPGNNATSIPPGIAWFDGDLNISSTNAAYYNTFIATGNITTGGSVKAYAPNFAGYNGTLGGVQYAPTGICENTYFPNIYPTAFCDTSTKTYLPDALGLGNLVFIAGSVKPGENYSKETYVGGNISPGAATELFGNVLAGNQFSSTGATTIHGYVTALGLGGVTQNSFGGKTTFNVKGLPPTFNQSLPGGSDKPKPDEDLTPGAWKIRWSRYL